MWYVHTTENFSALRRNEILIYVTTWMNHEDVMPSEISQSQEDKYRMIPFIWGIWNSQIHKDRKKVEQWLPGAGGEVGNGE